MPLLQSSLHVTRDLFQEKLKLALRILPIFANYKTRDKSEPCIVFKAKPIWKNISCFIKRVFISFHLFIGLSRE